MTTKPVNLRKAILDQAMRNDSPVGPESEKPPGHSSAASNSGTRQASRVNKVSVTGYFDPVVRRQLRRLAADADTTIQALLGEALNDLFAKHGQPEIVEGK